MAQALVTGGTGFVGSHLVRALNEAGHHVRVLHRPTSKRDALAGLAYESALGDLNDEDALYRAAAGCEWVFHVAAVADYWRADREAMFEANIGGTRRVLAAARAAGAVRTVFTSSAAALGFRHDGAPADEGVRFNASSSRFPYGYSKAMAEIVALEAVAAGQDVVIVNPVVVMGPGDLNVISGGFVMQIHRLGAWVPVTSGGVAVTDVRDVARWHIAAAEHGQRGERYILGTENVAYAAWFALIADVIGRPRPGFPVPDLALGPIASLIDGLKAVGIDLPVDGVQTRLGGRSIFFRFEKAWEALGEPRIAMRQSVADTFAWYREHGYL
jgi:dihydroflavonol-4-reductase